MQPPAGLPQRFEILRQVGAGGMGVVYEARDLERNLRVAIKTLQKADSRMLYHLKQEFRSLADITHPNLAALHELVSDGNDWFLIMEYIDGVDLMRHVRGAAAANAPTVTVLASAGTVMATEVIAEPSALSGQPAVAPLTDPAQFERLRAVVVQLASGITALHRAGKLHRDIKPTNVMIDGSGRAVLLDFGLAADLKGSLHEGAFDSSTSGTFAYMAPEQAAGLKLSEASDWYSLGVMIYEAIAGRLPFGGSRVEVQHARATQDPPPVREFAPTAPSDLTVVCTGLLHPHRRDRFTGPEVIRLLKGDVAAAASTRAHAFIGRARHLQTLQNAFTEMSNGRTAAVYVRGASGMGKSELIAHFLHDVETQSGSMVLRGRCYEREAVPFKAVDNLMDALAKRLGRFPVEDLRFYLPPNAAALGRVFRVLERIVESCGMPPLDAMDRQDLRQAAFASLRETMRRLAKHYKLVLYIDDLQWGDADSAALLSELLRQPDAPALLFIGSYRSEYEDSPCLRALLAEGSARAVAHQRIDVGVLESAEARELALSFLTGSAREQIAERIAQEAGGHPYLIAELASTAESAPEATEPRKISLDAVLWNRVAALPEKSKRLLEFVSVSGRPLRQDDAYAAAGYMERDPVLLGFLRSSRLVRGSGPGDQDVIEPYHDRVRETVVDHIPNEDLPRYHLRLAGVLEASGHADQETLAVHLEAGGSKEIAGNYYAAAADQAAAAVAFDRAVRLYRRAMELLPEGQTETRELRPKYAEALANAGCGAEAAEAFLQLAQQATGERKFEYRRKAAYYYCASGRVNEGRDTFREVLSRVHLRLPATQTGALLSVLVEDLRLRLRGFEFRKRAEAGIPRRLLERIDAAWAAGASLSTVDAYCGTSLLLRFLRLALDAGEPDRITRAIGLVASSLATTDPSGRGRATEMLRLQESLVDAQSRPELRGVHSMTAGIIAYGHARWNEALAHLIHAESLFSRECTGVAWEVSTCRMFLIWTLWYLGEFGEMGRLSSQWITAARERGDLFTMTNIGVYGEPFALMASAQADAARASVKSALGAWPKDRYYLQTFLGAVVSAAIDLYSGNPAAAWERLESEQPRMKRSWVLRVD
ncbi:MAG: protein kinase, partial [Acidobacteriia bacterium]|nr:protein kinase [Terriglobia bacterium]